jgi:hypothetical protein
MENIKELMTRYNKAQQGNQEATSLRKELIPLLKGAGLTKTKFDFGDRSISFHSYSNYEEVTQKLIRRLLIASYPQINPDQFIEDLYAARTKKSVETLRVQSRRS